MIDFFQINHGRVGVELLEHVIRAPILGELRDRPLRISRIAEGDGPRRTRGSARSGEFVGGELAMLECSAILRLTNALHTEGAFFHDTFAAHRYVGIQLPIERLGERILLAARLTIAKPVEVTNLVRTIVRAVASANTAIVHLHVEAVRRMVRRVHRTHRLTRRVTTMLTEHWDEPGLELFTEGAFVRSLEVALDAEPGHFAPASDVEPRRLRREESRVLPRGPDRRDIVLRVTGGDAGGASGAACQVDCHRPTTRSHVPWIVGIVETVILALMVVGGGAKHALGVSGNRRAHARQIFVTRVAYRPLFGFTPLNSARQIIGIHRLRDSSAVLSRGTFRARQRDMIADFRDRRLSCRENELA